MADNTLLNSQRYGVVYSADEDRERTELDRVAVRQYIAFFWC